MKRIVDLCLASCLSIVCALASGVAGASYHTFVIEELYSNADGSVQYVVLHEAYGQDGENLLGGRTLTSTANGVTKTYTFPNDLPGGSCGYYACNAAPTANKRVLIATQGFAALALMGADYVIPNGFLPIGGGTLNYADADVLSYSSLPVDGSHAIDRNGNTIVNVATNFNGNSTTVNPPATIAANFQGLWWNLPAGSESGWGINFNHQGATIFATWFTFGADGKPLWLVVSAAIKTPNVYTGTLFTGTGPPFNAFDPTKVVPVPAGTVTITFVDANTATFAYVLNGIAQTKQITRQVFAGPVPVCTFGGTGNAALAANYQDIWWNAPAASEPGWGVNLTHQGDTIFLTWFTFGQDGNPIWLAVSLAKTASGVYTGTLFKAVSGPPFNAVPFNPSLVVGVPAGNVTLTFANGNSASFAYTLDGIAQTKQITREIITAPGTLCL